MNLLFPFLSLQELLQKPSQVCDRSAEYSRVRTQCCPAFSSSENFTAICCLGLYSSKVTSLASLSPIWKKLEYKLVLRQSSYRSLTTYTVFAVRQALETTKLTPKFPTLCLYIVISTNLKCSFGDVEVRTVQDDDFGVVKHCHVDNRDASEVQTVQVGVQGEIVAQRMNAARQPVLCPWKQFTICGHRIDGLQRRCLVWLSTTFLQMDSQWNENNNLTEMLTYHVERVMFGYVNGVKAKREQSKSIFLTLVKVHPGKKQSTMVIEATITRNNTHTTIVRAEGREQDLRQQRIQD